MLEQPATLKANTKVKGIAAEDGETDTDLTNGCARLSESAFKNIWDNPLDADYDKL